MRELARLTYILHFLELAAKYSDNGSFMNVNQDTKAVLLGG